MKHEIKEKLQEIFRDIFDDDGIELFDEMNANDIDDWDSLAHIQLIAAIEKRFNVRFTTKEFVSTSNVGEFIDLLISKLN